MLSRIKALSERKDTHVQRKCAIWRIALYKCILRTTIISQRRPFFKIFFLEIVACPIIWAQQLCKLTTTNWKWTEIFCQLRKRYYKKKYCSKTFNDIKSSMRRKLQPEGLDAAQFWCYWKFFEFSTNICHSPASQNGTKTEKSYREMSKIYFLQ